MMWHDIDPKLIQSVSRYPRLYDKSIGSISTLSRRDAWMAVAQECDTPMDQCQARWKSLRDRYVRELNKSRTTGSVSFALFDNLSFLREHIQLRRKCALNASDQPTPSYYIDDITQDGPPSSMIVERPVEQEQEQEYLSDNAESSSVEFIAEESTINIESSSEHTHAPLNASNPEPANENQSPFFRVISLLEQALNEKSAPAEPQDPFYKYLESVLSRVDESTRGDIQLRLLNFAHEEIKKARQGSTK